MSQEWPGDFLVLMNVENLPSMTRRIPSSFNPAQAAKLMNRKTSPRDRRREKRIEDIVEAAVELFSKEGISGFSMRRVASKAGVTLSTLQHYFRTGENLLTITISSITSAYIDALRAIELDASQPPHVRFHVLTDKIIGWSTDPVVSDCYFELYALASKDKAVAKLIEEVYFAYYTFLTKFVEQLNPALTRDRAGMIALMIGAHIDGVMIVRYRAKTAMPASDEKIIAEMKNAWLREIFPATAPVDAVAASEISHSVSAEIVSADTPQEAISRIQRSTMRARRRR